ncbi:MAG: M48 family metalloprotease [Bacteroidales bacterium]|nr:M48 family metalloprotease [Bacteroidales bacterium]
MMSPSEFIHPEDAAALRQLESIPGFPTFVKSILSLGLERLQYGINMASSVRLSEQQLPDIYRHLPPICERLGIDIPEFYLSMDPVPNAWTFGDTRIFITVTSGLLETMDGEELDAVLGHECGHILCRHVLYHSVASYILSGVDMLGVLGKLTIPIQLAFLYWQRKSELSCDRAGAIVTSPEVVSRTMARLAAGPKDITAKINLEEWARQADRYDEIWNSNAWNKALQVYAIAQQNHPFSAVRVREILRWGQGDEYRRIKEGFLEAGEGKRCPKCHQPVENDWAFCRHCGYKLK